MDDRYPERTWAFVAILFGVLALPTAGLTGPVGWWIASRELRRIDQRRRDPRFERWASAGRTIGVVTTALFAAFWLLFILAFALVGLSGDF